MLLFKALHGSKPLQKRWFGWTLANELLCDLHRQAWDLAVDICLSQLPTIIEEGTAFRVSVYTKPLVHSLGFLKLWSSWTEDLQWWTGPGLQVWGWVSSSWVVDHQTVSCLETTKESKATSKPSKADQPMKGSLTQQTLVFLLLWAEVVLFPAKSWENKAGTRGIFCISTFILAFPLLHLLLRGGHLLHRSPGATLPSSVLLFSAITPHPLCWKHNWASEEHLRKEPDLLLVAPTFTCFLMEMLKHF